MGNRAGWVFSRVKKDFFSIKLKDRVFYVLLKYKLVMVLFEIIRHSTSRFIRKTNNVSKLKKYVDICKLMIV